MATIKQINVGGTSYDIKATYDGSGNTISSTYLKLSGGTMSGNITFGDSNIGIQRVGRSMSWNKGRDGAILKSTSLSGYSPLWSVKTNNGSWDIGAYDHSSYTDQLIFTYIKDTNYNGTNATTRQVIIRPNGDAGFGLRNISFGTAAPSGGSNGDIYIQYS